MGAGPWSRRVYQIGARIGTVPAMLAEEERAAPLRAGLVCLLLALFWSLPWAFRPPERTWGWDESMHAELPAAQMVLAARAGDAGRAAEALLDCNQYPFLWPLALAAVQRVTGISEVAARTATTWAWALALLGLHLLGRELARAQRGPGGRPRRNDDMLPWLALALGALSPLALAYAGTLFLEVPSALVAVFTLRAWLRRTTREGEPGARRRELAAGAWLIAGFFTKFNYGLLIGAGCLVDWLVEAVTRARRYRLGAFVARSAWLALPPALGFLWWLVLPWPGGPEVAERHRDALAGFLGGNLQLGETPWEQRALHWAAQFAASPRMLLLIALGLLLSLRELRRPGARALLLVTIALVVPITLHPFQLDRFLIPAGPAIWALSALGLARVLPAKQVVRALVAGALLLLATLPPGYDVVWLADRLGILREEPEVRAYQLEALRGLRRLDPARPLPTAGLHRREAEELLDLIAAEVGEDERVAWLGLSSELSPAAIHLGLLARGGSPARFLRDAHRPMDVTFESADPGWDDARLAEFARGFDVVFFTDPPDLRDRAGRRFEREYQQRLVERLGWEARPLGLVTLLVPGREPQPVRVYAARPGR